MLKLHQKGDTIVEVLLAIAVASAVLGGAFVSANRSFQGVRQSQERGEALELIEAQLERLKAAAKDDTKGIFPSSSPNAFCLLDTPALGRANLPGSTLPALGADNFGAYPVGCRQGAGGRYNLAIQRVDISGGAVNFIATARWDRVSGGRDEVRIVYRAYP